MSTPSASAVAQPSAAVAAVAAPRGRLDYLPVAFFGSASGVAGLGSAWRLAHLYFGLPEWPGAVLATLGLAGFVAIAIAYAVKLVSGPRAVIAEFRHPITGSLFGLVPISLVLLPIPLAPHLPRLALAMWVVGAVAMMTLTWLVMHRWLTARQQAEHAVPAWLIATGGPLNLPMALPALGLQQPLHELAVFALACGLFLSLPVFVLILSRLLFQEPPPAQSKAALLVLTAPFSLGYSAYVSVTGAVDLFAQGLYFVGLFLLSVLLSLLVNLPSCCPFRLSWWSVGFPMAALTSAAMRFAAAHPGSVNDGIALALLALSTLIVLSLLVRTTVGIVRGDLQALSGP